MNGDDAQQGFAANYDCIWTAPSSRWCLTSEAGGWLLVSKNDAGYCSNSMANWQLVEDEDSRLQKHPHA